MQFSVPEVSHVERFVGRQEQLNAIHQELQHDGSRKTVVVHGLGGMGKTQLALEYAEQHRKEYSAVFWVNSKSEDMLKQGYAAAAGRIYREHPSLMYLKAVSEGGNLDEAAEEVDEMDREGKAKDNGEGTVMHAAKPLASLQHVGSGRLDEKVVTGVRACRKTRSLCRGRRKRAPRSR